MDDWGQRVSPYWPDPGGIKQLSFAQTPIWDGGPTFQVMLSEAMPLVRALFLLGHRVRSIHGMDYVAAPKATSYQTGRWQFDFQTGLLEGRDALDAVAGPNGDILELEDTGQYLFFECEAVPDENGYLAETTVSTEALSYGVNLTATQVVVSVGGGASPLEALRSAMDMRAQDYFDLLSTSWLGLGPTNDLPRLAFGGMLWVFDPTHWQGIKGTWGRDYLTPKNLLKRVLFSADTKHQFILEQMFDVDLRSSIGLAGITTLADAVAYRRQTEQTPQRPTLKYYEHEPLVLSDNTHSETAASRRQSVRAKRFYNAVRYNIDVRGDTHIWSFQRRRSYIKNIPEPWLDTILALAWEGAILLPDAVLPRQAPDPLELVRNTVGGEERWEIWVHGLKAFTLDLFMEDETAASLSDKVAFDYRPGTRKQRQPTVMMVAGRGVDIRVHWIGKPAKPNGAKFKSHFKAYFDKYARIMPWRLEIYRVQDDALVPPMGTEINTGPLLSPQWHNPSPDQLDAQDDEGYFVPKVSLVYPFNYEENAAQTYGGLLEMGVMIQPHAHGVRLEFPFVQATDSTGLQREIKPGELFGGGRIPSAAVWDFYVNPFSGHAAYTYDLFLEQFSHLGNNVKNLHLVAIVTERIVDDVQLSTSLAADVSLGYSIWNALYDNLESTTADHPGYWGTRGAFLADVTAEFWKTKRSVIHSLPVPLGASLPVEMPPLGKAAQFMTSPSTTNRGDQTAARMPSGTEADTEWTTVRFIDPAVPLHANSPTIPNNALPLKKLAMSEWADNFVAEVTYTVIDIGLGFIPIVGDVVDIADFFQATITGRDRWGRPISQFDLILMGFAAAMPIASSGILRKAGALAGSPFVTPNIVVQAPLPDSFLTRLSPIYKTEGPADIADLEALFDASEEVMNLTFYNRSITSETTRRNVAQSFIADAVTKGGRLMARLDAIVEGAAENFLRLEDLLTADGKNFAFSVFQTDFKDASRRCLKDTGAILTPAKYLEFYARGISRAAAKGVLGAEAVGRVARKTAKKLKSPSFAGRAPRIGAGFPVSNIQADNLIDDVVDYFRAVVARQEGIRMRGAGYGSEKIGDIDYMGDPMDILESLGFVAENASDIDANHEIIRVLKDLMGGAAQGYPLREALLRGGRVGEKYLSHQEAGARVGEGLLLALDQLVHMAGVSELQGGTQLLDDVLGGSQRGPILDFVGQWLHGNGKIYEHALKSELVESSELHGRIARIKIAGDAGQVDELVAYNLKVVSQVQLPSTSGKAVQKAADEAIYYDEVLEAGGAEIVIRRVADAQIKAYRSIESVIGFNVIDGAAVTMGRYYGSNVPRVALTAAKRLVDGQQVWRWSVTGGSDIYRQVVKQRIRKAHYKGWVPPPELAKNPPANLPSTDPTVLHNLGWARDSLRHVYTINTAHIMDSLAEKLLKFVPPDRLSRATPADLTDFSRDEKAFLSTLYTEWSDPAGPFAVDLSDGIDFYDRFTVAKDDIRREIAAQINGYETEVPGFQNAMQAISGSNEPLDTHELYIRFTSDDGPDDALRFIVGLGGDLD